MKRRTVGIYQMGPDDVELALVPGTGGYFTTRPAKGCCGRIEIGADIREWETVAGVLQHEAMECVMMKMGFRFCPAPDYSLDNGGYLFVMTHLQFSEAVARTGPFLAEAFPDLKKAWNRRRSLK